MLTKYIKYFNVRSLYKLLMSSFMFFEFNSLCIFCTYNTSQFGEAIFQVCTYYMWLMAQYGHWSWGHTAHLATDSSATS